jgi:hypothetical protein
MLEGILLLVLLYSAAAIRKVVCKGGRCCIRLCTADVECRLEGVCNMNLKGTVEGERGGGEGVRVQFITNQGQEWMSFSPQRKKGISK